MRNLSKLSQPEFKNKGYLLVLLTAFISGFAIFINKFGVKGTNPYLYTFLRVFLVASFLTTLLFFLKSFKKLKKLTKKQWFLLILIGLLGGSFPFLLFFKGLSLTSSAKASFIHKTMFIYVALFASLFLKEKIGRKFLGGGLFLILANLLLLKKISLEGNLGDFFIFLATIFWATENVISKHLLKNLEGKEVAWGRMFFGSLFIFIFLLFSGEIVQLTTLNFSQIGWILITSFILFGYVISWYSGLKYIPVSEATAVLLLGGPITSFLLLIFQGRISQAQIFSGLLIIFGILIILGIKRVLEIFKEFKNLIYVRG